MTFRIVILLAVAVGVTGNHALVPGHAADMPNDAVSLIQRHATWLSTVGGQPVSTNHSFAGGVNGTNGCPDGFRSIVNEHMCKMGNAVLGVGPWRHKGSWPLLPKGCFMDLVGDVYLNSNASGTSKDGHMPICEEANPYFAAGSEGKTNCPPGFVSIDSENACRKARNALNLGKWKWRASWPRRPFGCYIDPQGDLYLNSNISGVGAHGHAPICQRQMLHQSGKPTMYVATAEGVKAQTPAQLKVQAMAQAQAQGQEQTQAMAMPQAQEGAQKQTSSQTVLPLDSVPGTMASPASTEFVSATAVESTNATANATVISAAVTEDDASALADSTSNFTAGANGTNSCPAGYNNIDNEHACRMAKNALGLPGPWRRKGNFPLKPFGCFTDEIGDLYLNSNVSGPGKEGHSPICEMDALPSSSSPIVEDAAVTETASTVESVGHASAEEHVRNFEELLNAITRATTSSSEADLLPHDAETLLAPAAGLEPSTNVPDEATSTDPSLEELASEIEQAHRAVAGEQVTNPSVSPLYSQAGLPELKAFSALR